jgi:SecD/SecF fusion protein
MQRNYLRGLLVCLIPCLVAAVFAVRFDKYRLGIDLAGGTILVYEINLERTKQRKESLGENTGPQSRSSSTAGLTSDEMNQLAGQIKRRIDPTDIKNVTVRPLGDNRIEIILPVSGAAGGGKSNLTTEDIEEVKRLISQMGVLEFRILANGPDDSEGIQAAQAAIKARTKEDLDFRAERGLPPEGPEGEFTVDVNDSKARVRYVWAELGPEERETLQLSNSRENSSLPWAILNSKRGQTVMLDTNGMGETQDTRSCRMLLFSRVCISRDELNREQKERERLERDGKTEDDIKQLLDAKKYEYFVLTRVSPEDSLRVGGDITMTATSSTDQKSYDPCVDFVFNGAGAQQFGKITRRNKPSRNVTRSLAILLDDRVVSAPTIQSEITSHGQITGKFDRKTVDRLVQILRSGALSAELRDKPVSENTIGPTLGADTIRRGTTAVGMAFIAILVFMIFYYRFAGIVACIALFANLLLTVGFMVAVNAAFTLPGLAGLVLTLGMAVDANVLIYERLREERNKGANLITAIRNGYDRAFPTIIDTHLTSIFTAIVLYTLGNDNLKGFAISLTVGLVISLFTSLYMTRLMFDFWQHKKWLTELKMMRLFEKPNFHPMKYRYIFFTITGALTILGLALFLYRGEAGLNVDFRGGTVFAGRLKDGEERALTTTPDGKPGFRELLDEENQKKRLHAVKAVWENKPSEGSAATVNTFIYTITYADTNGANTSTTITLSHKPDGNTDNEMADNVIARASHLPDVSVEQMFLSKDTYPEGKSRYFTIRTTEKQPELVRAVLDRLLRDEHDKSLMFGAVMTFPETKIKVKAADGKEQEETVPATTGGSVELTFSQPTSRSFVQELFDREFRITLRQDLTLELFSLTGAGFEITDQTSNALRTAKVPEEVLKKLTPLKDKAFSQEDMGKELAKVLTAGELDQYKRDIMFQAVADVNGRFNKMKLDVSRNPAFDQLAAASPDIQKRNEQLALLQQILSSAKSSFDATPEPQRLEVFDSVLAKETRTKALFAIGASWLAILLYLWFRFLNWTFGLAAVICLIHDLCFTLGAIAVCHYLHLIPGFDWLGIQDFKIDLASVAALLTLVGYSVSDTIVVFDRIREVRGKNPKLTPAMINDSVNQTLSRTMLTAATVFLVSFVLYAFGGEGIHLFAFVMVMGVLVGTYSSVFVAAPLLLIFGEGHDEEAIATSTSDEPSATKEESTEEVLEG